MIRAVIFDFFGVIYGQRWQVTYSKLGGDLEKDRDYIRKYVYENNQGTITTEQYEKIVAARLGISLEEYKHSLKQVEQPNFELIDYIKNELKPKYKIALLSNSGIGQVGSKIPKSILDIFDELILSGEEGVIKPDPAIYQIALDKLNVNASEAVFVDDIDRFVSAAEDCGIKSILYQDFTSFRQQIEDVISRQQ